MKQLLFNLHLDHQLISHQVWLIAMLIFSTGVSACSKNATDQVSGDWRAIVLNKAGEEIGFKLEIKHTGEQVSGALVNGEQRVESTSGSFDGQTLKLRFDFYDGELTATLANGELRGDFKRQLRKDILRREFRAWRETASTKMITTLSADLSGDWLLRVGEGDKQRTWRYLQTTRRRGQRHYHSLERRLGNDDRQV